MLIPLSQSLHRLKTADLLSFVSLQFALSSGAASGLGLSESEAPAVFAAGESLLGADPDRKAEVIRGFLSGEGEFQSIPCERNFLSSR